MSRGGPGGSGGVWRGPGRGRKNLKTRKKLRSCMARRLRRNIQDFVQEVPVGQMGQGKLNLPSVQHATQGSADIYVYIYIEYTFAYNIHEHAQRHRRIHIHIHMIHYIYMRIHAQLRPNILNSLPRSLSGARDEARDR